MGGALSAAAEGVAGFLRNAAEEMRPGLRFYLGEPVWWHPGWSLGSIARTSSCALLVSSCSATLARLIDPENSFALGLWLGCTAAALLLWACALGAAGALGFWFLLWAVRTWRRRARCRRILRANGWPRVLISPRLLEFDDRSWGRLPPHEHFALTPWCTRWKGGAVRPLNLYAALALTEELHAPPSNPGEEPLDAASTRVEELVEVLEHGRVTDPRPKPDEPEGPLRPIPPMLWLDVLLQPLGGTPVGRRTDQHRRREKGNPVE